MRGIPNIAALALAAAASPALAEDYASPDHRAVADAVTGFMDAIASEDKTLLANHMVPEGLIFIHNHIDPDNPGIDTVPVAQHLERWAARTGDYEEMMSYDHVLVSGDMAQVWGPYSFTYNGTLTHCGVNSIGLVRGEDGAWKVGNTSFTMVAPERCAEVGASWVDDQ
ncbi:MAG: Cif family virulence factor [Erythrobacter sp.]